VEAGCLPTLLPGGRPVQDAAARVDVGTVWGATAPTTPGRDGNAILVAAAAGELGGLVVGGVDPADLRDATAARAALTAVGFLVSLEIRTSAVTELADVVLPVATAAEKEGSFVNWEGRVRTFGKVLRQSNALPDARVLAGIAEEMRTPLGFRTVGQVRAEMEELGRWDGARTELPTVVVETAPTRLAPRPADGLVLSTWKRMIGDGRMLAGADYLQATARAPVALVSPATLELLGLVAGQDVSLSDASSTVVLPLGVADLPDGVVWAPTSDAWSVSNGTVVRLAGVHSATAQEATA
jgi:NADH-quinone oxidoreductase subunit G